MGRGFGLYVMMAALCFGCAGDDSPGSDSDKSDTSDYPDGIDWSRVQECFNFDVECPEGTVCRPLDLGEEKHVCLPAGPVGLCDSDSDCGADGFCVGEVGWLDLLSMFAEIPPHAGRCHSIKEEGEQCYNFNFECRGDLVCRPGDWEESYQTCQPDDGSGWCDDDDDCNQENGFFCIGEDGHAGQCVKINGANERCWFNIECGDGYTCVPSRHQNWLGEYESFCVPLRETGETCDDNDDCVGVTSYCQWQGGVGSASHKCEGG
jgi:hypothetical protein